METYTSGQVYVFKEDKVALHNLFVDLIERDKVDIYLDELRSLANILQIDPVSFFEYTQRDFLSEEEKEETKRYLEEMDASDLLDDENYYLYSAI